MQTVAANSAGSIISFTNQKKKQKKKLYWKELFD